MVCICTPLGLHPPFFFPQKAGKDYELTPYLEVVKEFRNDFTVISGLSHPDVGPSHDSIYSFLTAAPHPERRAGFRNTISLDQFAAEHIGGQTRYASLRSACEGFGLSWTRSGAPVPSDAWPSSVFARLFLEGRPDEVAGPGAPAARRPEHPRRGPRPGQAVAAGPRRATTATSSTSTSPASASWSSGWPQAEEWSKKPKPKVDAKPPQNITNRADLIGKTRVWFDLIHLALQTDSTRLVTLQLLGTSGVPPIPGVTLGHHDLSHHGQDPNKIEQLKKVELEKMKTLRDFLEKLKDTKEEGDSLLDRTMVFFSSNLGNASNHGVKNMPVLLAGGGFKHGQHLAFDPKNPPPLCNLYVSMLQRLGIERGQVRLQHGHADGAGILRMASIGSLLIVLLAELWRVQLRVVAVLFCS